MADGKASLIIVNESTDPKPTENVDIHSFKGWADELWLLELDTGDAYRFNGVGWDFVYHLGGIIGDGVSKITVGITPPEDPAVGDLFVDCS